MAEASLVRNRRSLLGKFSHEFDKILLSSATNDMGLLVPRMFEFGKISLGEFLRHRMLNLPPVTFRTGNTRYSVTVASSCTLVIPSRLNLSSCRRRSPYDPGEFFDLQV